MLIKVLKLVQYNFKCYWTCKVWRHLV